MRAFWSLKYAECKSVAPGCALMGRHQLCAPYAAAVCDRGFSTQNMIITKGRTLIVTLSLRDQMMIALNGPGWDKQEKLTQIILKALRIWSVGRRL